MWFDTGPQDYAVECYSYDLAGNIIEKRIEDAANAILLQKHFTYNLQGQCEEEYTSENGIKGLLLKLFITLKESLSVISMDLDKKPKSSSIITIPTLSVKLS